MLLQVYEPGQTPDPHSAGVATSKQGLAIGIDLGTTHSVAAILERGDNGDSRVRVLATDAAARRPSLMPSVVAYGRDGPVAAVRPAAQRFLAQGDYPVIRSSTRPMCGGAEGCQSI